MNGQRYIHDIDMMGYYSALKKRKKKERKSSICDNIDEPKGHYAM